MRKDPIADNEIYHVFSRSIAEYVIFNHENDYQRMLQLVKYYQQKEEIRFSYFIRQKYVQKIGLDASMLNFVNDKDNFVRIISYCLMPTHIHLILEQLKKNGISDFMRRLLDSYTRYFNSLHHRKGPLWESKFSNVLIKNDEQLQHVVRYLHLNPTTANLVKKPEDWIFSSYNEYLGNTDRSYCHYDSLFDIDPNKYKKFTNDQISYQRELGKIKRLLLE